MERKTSGIPGFDVFIGGGFPDGSITTISGPPGAGKTTFGLQFAVGGAENDEKSIYLVLEDTKRVFMQYASTYSWDIRKYEKEGMITILDYPIDETDQLIARSSAVEELIFTTGAERLIIDSIRPLAVRYDEEEERMRAFLRLINNIRSWDITTLIISNDTNQTTINMIPQTSYGIETLTDGWIHLYFTYENKQRKRRMEILKMRGTHHYRGFIPYEIHDNGISLL